jgi:hypothetical protein
MDAVALVVRLATPQTGMGIPKVSNEVTWFWGPIHIRAPGQSCASEGRTSRSTTNQGPQMPRTSASARALWRDGDTVCAQAVSARKVGRLWNL